MATDISRLTAINVFSHGEKDVGIPDYSIKLGADTTTIYDFTHLAEEDREPALNNFREDLATAFENLFGEDVEITFDYDAD